MVYENISLLKENEKGAIHLVKEKGKEQIMVRKVLTGAHDVYRKLKDYPPHAYLPRLYEVVVTDDSTTVFEEYIEGQLLSDMELSEKQAVGAIKELCSVLEFLHGKGIIHRDIKPSNIMLARDGHIRLLDFDAARMPKDNSEQDTSLLGTRGYAPPEQYGFSQTDERADIYALGVTIKTLLKDKARKPHYHRIIQKCTNLNPDNRYRSVKQVKDALSYKKLCIFAGTGLAVIAAAAALFTAGSQTGLIIRHNDVNDSQENLTVLPAPENPHWNGESGIAVWGNVPESGDGGGEVGYHYRIYRRDTPTPPDLENDNWDIEGNMRGNALIDVETSTYRLNIASELDKDGFYYFSVSADGDGISYLSSPYVLSDAFEYTGESAPTLPAPTGLLWKMAETDNGRAYYATWDNLDDYEDTDSFNITVYDKDGNYVMNNIWTKEYIVDRGQGGIQVQKEYLADKNNQYRFTVEAHTSRPNEYKSFLLSEPIPEEYFSPWYLWRKE